MSRQSYFIINAILQLSNATKQVMGQRIAYFLGLNPGPRGADDGIDGSININGVKIQFQSKLRTSHLDKDDARTLYADIAYHKPNVVIMLSGVGYKETFTQRLFFYDDIKSIKVHLLILRDILEHTDAFSRACADLPALRFLDEEIKKEIG